MPSSNQTIDAGTGLKLDDAVAAQVAHVRELEPWDAVYGAASSPIDSLLSSRLSALGLGDLYTHQARAYDEAMAGNDLVVVTGTNSGKTLCYNLPALQFALREPAARMLYLFPTKALAQDQLGKLEELLPGSPIRFATYDGDTPQAQRSAIRKSAHVILTNPDMLHVGILPGHENWSKFLRSLRLIVLDEMHVYRGVFGSHVGAIMRRLLRLCEYQRSRPQIIACSATIGNPKELFTKLTGREPVVIDEDGSPRGKRTFVFWNPPELGQGRRMSSNVVTSEIMVGLAEQGKRTLAFNRARVSAELVLRYARQRAKNGGEIPPSSIESYRAGYTVKERRQIEQSLFKGELLAVSATNAMELGVDIGMLDAVVMNGYPGTVSSFWQQSGRAGRGTRDGLAIMVAHDDPLEQFLLRNPDMVMDAQIERVAVNPENPQILSQQLRCAAHERPISPMELAEFGESALGVAESLDMAGDLKLQAGHFYYPSHEAPAPGINIRGSGGEQFSLVVQAEDRVQVLGTMERWRAMQQAHAGAVYLHRGGNYVVKELDLDRREASLLNLDTDYYTQSIVQSVVESRWDLRSCDLRGAKASLCGITVTDSVTGFRLKSVETDNLLGTEELELPSSTYETLAVRFDLPMQEGADAASSLHGVEHALMAIAPLVSGTDRGDLGSAWYAFYPETFSTAIFVFDRTPGGVGLAERLFDSLPGWVSGARQLLASCPCEAGCPACLLSARCEANNESLSKNGALRTLESLS